MNYFSVTEFKFAFVQPLVSISVIHLQCYGNANEKLAWDPLETVSNLLLSFV